MANIKSNELLLFAWRLGSSSGEYHLVRERTPKSMCGIPTIGLAPRGALYPGYFTRSGPLCSKCLEAGVESGIVELPKENT